MAKKRANLNYWRLLLQWSVVLWIAFLLMRQWVDSTFTADFEAYCPFGGLQALSSYLVRGTLACSMTSVQIVMGVLLFLAVVVFSKLFCAYICPLGTIIESLGKLGERMHVRITVTGIADKILRSLKYVLLFVTMYGTITASELFCKNFDPYYAAASGMNPDVTVWMAVISFVLVLVGSIFIRMFWCKYICPLGAISNIFKFVMIFVGVLALYGVVLTLGFEMSWIVPLALLCVVGYVLEVVKGEARFAPFVHVTRDEDTCVNCNLCSKKCPQGIDVATLSVVKDVDCNLCGDCVSACPVSNTLTYNSKKKVRWVPATVTLLLIIAGLFLGAQWEVPTINEKWGDPALLANAKVFEKSGLSNVKCYGSSKAFSAKMQRVKGVLGVATYVGTHSVKVYYDPNQINDEQIMKQIFTSVKLKIKAPEQGIDSLKVVTLGVENLFGKMDANYLKLVLREKDGFYGMETEYACPVKVKIYVREDVDVTKDHLKEIIETKELVFGAHGKERHIPLHFELVSVDDNIQMLDRKAFMSSMFRKYRTVFRKREQSHKGEVLGVYEVSHSGLEKPIVMRALPYLSSQMSNNKGVVSVETFMKADESVVLRVNFSKEVTNADSLWAQLIAPKWKINYRDGSVKELDSKLQFKTKGHLVE